METVLLVMEGLPVVVFHAHQQIRQLMGQNSVYVILMSTKIQVIQVNVCLVMEIVLLVMGELLVIVFLVVR